MCIISISAALGTSIATALGISVASGTVMGTAVAGATAAGATTATVLAAGVAPIAVTTGTAISASAATAIGLGAIGIGAAAIGATIAGGVLGTVSSVQQAEAQKRQAEFLASQAEENARLSYRRAENIELQANQKRVALLMESQQKRGTARTGFAANGVVLGSGVTADYEADIANAYDLDLKNYNYDVASQAWQAKVQGVNAANSAALYRAQAGMYGQQRASSLLGGLIGTAGSTLSSVFNMATGLAKFGGGKVSGGTRTALS